ncbi:transposase [Synechococcus sp. CS-1328]|uniref:transposase n=1 Tax=Synechococcus sp. CS-1328 TaxID=2847976 RepID=UPI00223BB707|nr:transposase [Synechococcus sp. CS-1328]MCT0224353.1 transposase [Synechococcus sp. CS-1328]
MGQIGAHAVLHTHSRRLNYHPHVHLTVPAGAVDEQKNQWRRKRGNHLFPARNLARVFRAKWFEAIRLAGLHAQESVPSQWVVDYKAVGRGGKALHYLGRYLYRGVIRNLTSLLIKVGA